MLSWPLTGTNAPVNPADDHVARASATVRSTSWGTVAQGTGVGSGVGVGLGVGRGVGRGVGSGGVGVAGGAGVLVRSVGAAVRSTTVPGSLGGRGVSPGFALAAGDGSPDAMGSPDAASLGLAGTWLA